jgi:hypothetical protein
MQNGEQDRIRVKMYCISRKLRQLMHFPEILILV